MTMRPFILRDRERMDLRRAALLLWIGALAIAVFLLAAALLYRLGLPSGPLFGVALGGIIVVVLMLGFLGRTAVTRVYFFAGRQMPPAVSGFGGGFDFGGGVFWLIFAAASASLKLVLAPAIVLGIFVMSGVFSRNIRSSGSATASGLLSRRYPWQGAGSVSLAIAIAGLLALAIAEAQLGVAVIEAVFPGRADAALIGLVLLALAIGLLGGQMAHAFFGLAMAFAFMLLTAGTTIVLGIAPELLDPTIRIVPEITLDRLNVMAGPGFPEMTGSTDRLAIIVVVVCGVSVLPHAASRLAVVDKPRQAMEHLGWSSLWVFVTLSSIPLSIGLLVGGGATELGRNALMHPVFVLVAWLALLIASFAAFAMTFFSLSVHLARGVQRLLVRSPDDFSMALSRFLLVAMAGGMIWLGLPTNVAPTTLFIDALCVLAAGLFVPMVIACTLDRVPGYAMTAACLIGVTPLLVYFLRFEPTDLRFVSMTQLWLVSVGMAAALLILLAARALAIRFPRLAGGQKTREPENSAQQEV